MEVFAEKFDDSVTITSKLYKAFITDAKSTLYFDEDETDNLIYFAYSLYDQKRSQFKGKMSKEELLRKLANLLNYLYPDNILSLKGHELLVLLYAPNPVKMFDEFFS